MGAPRRHERLKRRQQWRVAACAMVRDDARVDALRPNTKIYDPAARRRLGVAVARAREALGHRWRPSFAEQAGISVPSLLNLESGRPVGPTVYEAVARAIPGWDEDTPRAVLEGATPPSAAAVRPEFSPEITARLDRIERNLGYRARLETEEVLRAARDSDTERGVS